MERLPLDPDLHQPTRLRIIALLHRNRSGSFAWIRETLELTDGNLGRHMGRLEDLGYVRRARVLSPTGFQLRLFITNAGEKAFDRYLASLREFLIRTASESGTLGSSQSNQDDHIHRR